MLNPPHGAAAAARVDLETELDGLKTKFIESFAWSLVRTKFRDFWRIESAKASLAEIQECFEALQTKIKAFSLLEDSSPTDNERYTKELNRFRIALARSVKHVDQVWFKVKATRISFGVIGGGVIGGAAVVAAPMALAAAGFGAGGVVGGSAAASIQSAVYGGATTGVFSLCQSIGAAGLSTATTVMVPTATAVVGGTATTAAVLKE